MKTCRTCGVAKGPDAFGVTRGYVKGECKDCSNAKHRAAYRINSIAHQEAQRRVYLVLRAETVAAYGGRCECCGESEPAFLELDHIDGGGNQHRRDLGGGGTKLYRWLKRHGYPPVVQVLCSNCNQGKARNGFCPHQIDLLIRAGQTREAVQ